jgi:hypothetical protein
MYKAAAVLSALIKLYIIPCHYRGHIHVMVVLQSRTDSLHILPASSGESHATSSGGAHNFSNLEVEENVVVVEEVFIAENEEANIGIKQEEIPKDIPFTAIKAEPDEVRYVCLCLLLDTFYQCPTLSVDFGHQFFLANWKSFTVGNDKFF